MEIRHSAHISKRKPPVNLSEKDRPLFAHEFEKQIGESHVVTLKSAFVLGDSLFTFQPLRFYSSCTHINYVRKKDRLKALMLLLKPKQRLERAVWIIDNGVAGYFHWLTDALPRLVAANEPDGVVLLPSAYKKMGYMKQSLDLIGAEACFYDETKPLRVAQLVLPNHTAPSGNYNKTYITELRKRFIGAADRAPHRLVYISRQKAPKRHVLNENAVQGVIKQFGFEVHCFEDYDLATQVRLMSETRCLAGLHGAGLTNMLFMRAGTQLLELRNAGDAHNNCYFSMASDLNIEYYYLLNNGTSADTHTSDIEVDVNELAAVLKLMSES
ncbi:MAG: glycosyltransferase family 61 protein [Bacteroidia bacterium]